MTSFTVYCPDAPPRHHSTIPGLPPCVAPGWARPRVHATLKSAEKSARTLCRLHGQRWTITRDSDNVVVAKVCDDAMGRIWTDVMHMSEAML